MSAVKSNAFQIGQSVTATNNFTFYQPSTPDGTVRLGVGNSGATTLDAVTVNSSGNVGIGTSSPTTSIDISRTGANANVLLTRTDASVAGSTKLEEGNSGTFLYQSGAKSIIFGTNNAEKMRLDSSGNLGLGVTPSGWSATYKALQVGATASLWSGASGELASVMSNGYFNGSSYLRLIAGYASSYDQSGGAHYWKIAGNSTAGSTISWTQAMTLDASGNLGIGTTSPSSKLDVQGDPSTALVAIKSTAASDSANRVLNLVKYANDSTTSQVFATFAINQGATGSGRINANGASAAAFGSFSDARLKENITALPNQLASILALKPSEFDYKDGSGHQIGFIAQEMQEVYPDVVGEDEDGMLTITGWSKTEARLVKAIQELSAELNELKAKVNA